METADIGLIGLAVMGENLALNFESKGYAVAVYNRRSPGREHAADRFVEGRGRGRRFVGTHSIRELVESVRRPRRILMMIRAGEPVDEMIGQLMPYLEPGDVVIDGGNSDYLDTRRRVAQAEKAGLLFVGCGVSGGELGALHGPSLMPGGSAAAWPLIKEPFQAIAAKLDDGSPCCEWIGPGGSGHFVKTVHNGIEYGDMQLIFMINTHFTISGIGIHMVSYQSQGVAMHEKAVALGIVYGNRTPGGNGIAGQFIVETVITGKHILVYRIIHLYIIEGFAISQFAIVKKTVAGKFLAFISQYGTVQ